MKKGQMSEKVAIKYVRIVRAAGRYVVRDWKGQDLFANSLYNMCLDWIKENKKTLKNKNEIPTDPVVKSKEIKNDSCRECFKPSNGKPLCPDCLDEKLANLRYNSFKILDVRKEQIKKLSKIKD